jgi:hypothetical protein
MPNIVPLLDLSGTISDLIPKKDALVLASHLD